MAEASDSLGILHQILLDAGCDGQTIKLCMAYARSGDWSSIAAHLVKYRKALLAQIHTKQRQIDCLDFLTFKIQKEFK